MFTLANLRLGEPEFRCFNNCSLEKLHVNGIKVESKIDQKIYR